MLRSIEAKEGRDRKHEQIWLVNVGGLSPLEKLTDPLEIDGWKITCPFEHVPLYREHG